MLGDEFGTASNIKSRVNRQSVLGAITSAQQRLKLYNKVSIQACLISCQQRWKALHLNAMSAWVTWDIVRAAISPLACKTVWSVCQTFEHTAWKQQQ